MTIWGANAKAVILSSFRLLVVDHQWGFFKGLIKVKFPVIKALLQA